MQSHQHTQFAKPRTETNTIWYNPLDVPQRVRVFYGDGAKNERVPTEYVFAPKTDTQVPSRFDSAIQVVHCAEDSCRLKAPGYCINQHHEGTVTGGLAPQLLRKGQVAKLLPALDPSYAELEEVKSQLAAQNIARVAAENAQVIAESRRQELEAELAKKNADERLDAATRPDPKSRPKAEPKDPGLPKA
jgi:hypothetical protein